MKYKNKIKYINIYKAQLNTVATEILYVNVVKNSHKIKLLHFIQSSIKTKFKFIYQS